MLNPPPPPPEPPKPSEPTAVEPTAPTDTPKPPEPEPEPATVVEKRPVPKPKPPKPPKPPNAEDKPAEPAPAVEPDEPAPATTDLVEAEQALRAGNFDETIRLARRSLTVKPTDHAYMLITVGFCGKHDISNARANLQNARGRARIRALRTCKNLDFPLQ